MTPLYAGFDTVDLALQGAFPPDTIDRLAEAREEAAARQEAVLVKVGPGEVAMHLAPSGLRGGYAFRADTGPLGEVLAFKANSNVREWNGFASIRARTLAAYGFHGARDQLFARLTDMGFRLAAHSINRIDYAVDFLAPAFALRLDGFVAHPRTKVRPYWGVASPQDPNQPSAVLTGRRLESVTIGKMPGRQIIVYDKRRAAIAQRKLFWFKVWGLDRASPDTEVWRVEVRAGKKELKDRWGIRTFDDVDRSMGDVVRYALDEVRYLAPLQTDSNVTRRKLDPLWLAMIEQSEGRLSSFSSGILPSALKEVEQEIAIETYRGLVLGNIAGLAVAEGMDQEAIETLLPERARELVSAAVNDPRGKFQKGVDRARERLHFVAPNAASKRQYHNGWV